MSSRSLLFAQFCVLLVLGTMHYFGLRDYLYWQYRWYDIPAHFLGGVWAAFAAAWLMSLTGKVPKIWVFILGAFTLGLIWEGFEYSIGITEYPSDLFDTLKDMCMDTLGGVIASLIHAFVSSRAKQVV